MTYGLIHPLLPIREAGMLCLTFVKEQLAKPWYDRFRLYPHSDAERTFTGTWWSEELKLALDQGYQVYEVWNLAFWTSLFLKSISTQLIKEKSNLTAGFSPMLPIIQTVEPTTSATTCSVREWHSTQNVLRKIPVAEPCVNSWPTAFVQVRRANQ